MRRGAAGGLTRHLSSRRLSRRRLALLLLLAVAAVVALLVVLLLLVMGRLRLPSASRRASPHLQTDRWTPSVK